MYGILDSFREGGVTGMTISVDSYLSVASFLHVPLFLEFSQPSFAGRAV